MGSIYQPTPEVLTYIRENIEADLATGRILNKHEGYCGKYIYVWIRPDGIRSDQCRSLKRSHIIWFLKHGEWPAVTVDHINRVHDDDRIDNLRLSSRTLQGLNRDVSLNRELPPYIHYNKKSSTYQASKWISDNKLDYIGSSKNLDELIEVVNAYRLDYNLKE